MANQYVQSFTGHFSPEPPTLRFWIHPPSYINVVSFRRQITAPRLYEVEPANIADFQDDFPCDNMASIMQQLPKPRCRRYVAVYPVEEVHPLVTNRCRGFEPGINHPRIQRDAREFWLEEAGQFDVFVNTIETKRRHMPSIDFRNHDEAYARARVGEALKDVHASPEDLIRHYNLHDQTYSPALSKTETVPAVISSEGDAEMPATTERWLPLRNPDDLRDKVTDAVDALHMIHLMQLWPLHIYTERPRDVDDDTEEEGDRDERSDSDSTRSHGRSEMDCWVSESDDERYPAQWHHFTGGLRWWIKL